MMEEKHQKESEVKETRKLPSSHNAPSIKAIDGRSAHQICSGQVIVSLATAVKELVENSIDANANNIEIKLKDYGMDTIEVHDNGSGIEEKDYEALGLKHYTSKLREFSDLSIVDTFGFRGEAVSSLCALSKLTVNTRHTSKEAGCKLEFNYDGKLISKSPCAREQGTTVSISQLFHTLPVRHKEFKRNIKKEFAKLNMVLQAYGIISTGIKFNVVNCTEKNRKNVLLSTSGGDSLLENIASIFGAKQVGSLLEFVLQPPSEEILEQFNISPDTAAEHTNVFAIKGYFSRTEPGCGRSSLDRQFYFVNKRPCDLNKVSRLVNEVYHMFNRKQYPFVAMEISLRSDHVDVNVTPDKRQLFIEHEKLLLAILKTSLLKMFSDTAGQYLINAPIEHCNIIGSIKSSPKMDDTASDIDLTDEQISESNHSTSVCDATLDSSSILNRFRSRFVRNDIKQTQQCERKTQTLIEKFAIKFKNENTSNSSKIDESPEKFTSSGESYSKSDLEVQDSRLEDSAKHDSDSRYASISKRKELCPNLYDSEDITTHASQRTTEYENDGYTAVIDKTSNRMEDKAIDGNAFIEENEVYKVLPRCNKSNLEGCENLKDQRDKASQDICFDDLKKVSSEIEGNSSETNRFMTDSERLRLQSNSNNPKLGGSSVGDSQQNNGDDYKVHAIVETRDLESSNLNDGSNGPMNEPCGSPVTNPSLKEVSQFVMVNGDHVTTAKENKITLINLESPCLNYDCNEEAQDFSTRDSVTGIESKVLMSSLEIRKSEKRKDLECSNRSRQHGSLKRPRLDSPSVSSRPNVMLSFNMETLRRNIRSHHHSDETDNNDKLRGFRAKISPSQNSNAEEELRKNITKDMFKNMEILGQFNLGFIIAKLDHDLFIIDQHASDEKYNFERLQREHCLKGQRLIQPQTLELTASSEGILIDNIDIFTKNGFDFIIDESKPATQRVKLVSLPTSRNWTFGVEDIEELIFMLSDTPGVVCRPSRVRNMFASRACRMSTMVGSSLNVFQMKKLVTHMGEIEHPWNCPHGRPTMRHLINLQRIERKGLKNCEDSTKHDSCQQDLVEQIIDQD